MQKYKNSFLGLLLLTAFSIVLKKYYAFIPFQIEEKHYFCK